MHRFSSNRNNRATNDYKVCIFMTVVFILNIIKIALIYLIISPKFDGQSQKNFTILQTVISLNFTIKHTVISLCLQFHNPIFIQFWK